MLVCPSCNNMQESGKFCGFCGMETVPAEISKLQQEIEAVSETAAAAVTVDPGSSVNTETVKEVAGQYWSYIIQLFKNPSRAFHSSENHLVYGLVTMALYVFSIALTIYIALNSVVKNYVFLGESLPFFPFVPRMFLWLALMLAITFFSAVVFNKIGKSVLSIKKMAAQFGGLLVPFIGLNAVAMFGSIVGSFWLTIVPLVNSCLFVFTYVPVLFVYEMTKGDRFRIYWGFSTILVSSIVIYVVGEALISDQMINIIYLLDNYL